MTMQPEQLHRLPLNQLAGLFTSLDPPEREALRGLFQGSLLGPVRLRRLEKLLLAVAGLGGWWGKDFDAQGNAINLVLRKGKLERRFPMLLAAQNSFIDRKPGLALYYAPGNPFPWPWIVDELRSLQPNLLLGMSIARPRLFHRLGLPFILQATEKSDGL